MSKLADMKTIILDSAGMYDEFTIADVLSWFHEDDAQSLRDAVRELVRAGLLESIGVGTYRWTKNA